MPSPAPRAEALAALHHCVLRDPRRDWQVENRSLYYARLCLDLDAELDEIEQHLFHPDDLVNDDEARTGLALSVLGHLAAYGRADALRLLRRYTAAGSNWEWALDELALPATTTPGCAAWPPRSSPASPSRDHRGRRRAGRRRTRRLRTPALAGRRAADPHHGPRVRAAAEQGAFDRWQRQLRPSGPRPGWSVHDIRSWAQREH
ncbi:HEAT repeat domain-containing protein OS=Streptomyces antimycoticus OX=68175 GN=SSPO_085970 PE=4 SV=1 [Streptomyces antimycoticus]